MKKHLLLFALLLLISETMFGQEQGFNISVYTDPSNGVGGSAYVGNTQSQTDSTFHYNDICTIHAIANESAGYHFVKWTAGDGIEIQEPEYAFYVTQDSSFIAHFALTDFAITYTNNGNGSCSGNPTAHFNEEVTVTVTPETGYELNMTPTRQTAA